MPLQFPVSGNVNAVGDGGSRAPASSAIKRKLSGTHSGEAPVCTASVNASWVPSKEAPVIEIFDWPSFHVSGDFAYELTKLAAAEEVENADEVGFVNGVPDVEDGTPSVMRLVVLEAWPEPAT